MRRRQLSRLDECRDCVCLALRAAARRVTQKYDVALAGTGLRATQFTLLVMVHHLGAPTMKALARMLNSDPTTVTRNVQGLSKRRLVSISPGKDLRERKAKLTVLGEAIVLRALPNWRKAQNDAIASLDRIELPRLLTLLEQVGQRRSKH